MNNQIGQHVWNYARHVQHNFLGFVITTTALPLWPIQPSSPSTKELYGLLLDGLLVGLLV